MLLNSKQVDSGLMSLEENIMSDETQISDQELWRTTLDQSPQSESLLTQTEPKPLNHSSLPYQHSQIVNHQSTPAHDVRQENAMPRDLYHQQPTLTQDAQESSNLNHFETCKEQLNNLEPDQNYLCPPSTSTYQQATRAISSRDVRQEQTNITQQLTNVETSQFLSYYPTPTSTRHHATNPQQVVGQQPNFIQKFTNIEPCQMYSCPTSTTRHQVTSFNSSLDVRQKQTNIAQHFINLGSSQPLRHYQTPAVVQEPTNLTQQLTNLEPSQMYRYATSNPRQDVHQDQPNLNQQAANLDHSRMLYFYQMPPSTQALRHQPSIDFNQLQAVRQEQSQLNYKLQDLTQEQFVTLNQFASIQQPHNSSTQQATDLAELQNLYNQNVKIPATVLNEPSQLQQFVLLPSKQSNQFHINKPCLDLSKSNYKPQIIIDNLQKSLPKNEKTQDKNNKTLDDICVNNFSTQTPIILPSEETELSKNVLHHIHLIRGILGAKQFDMIPCEGGKRASSPDLNLVSTEKKKPKICEPQVECIDLTSSPPLHPPNYHHQQLRYAFRNSGAEQGIAANLESLTDYAEKEMLSRAEYVCEFWTGSLMELCVDTIIRTACSQDARAASIVSRFSLNLVSAIIHHNQLRGGESLEGISNIIVKLSECQSVAVDVAEHVLVILPRHLDQIFTANVSLVPSIRLLENLYHILRILATIFNRLKHETNIIGSAKENKNGDGVNIMNLWRKHWRPAGEERGGWVGSSLSPLLSRFLNKLELLVRFSLTHAPLLSPFLTECLQLAQKMHFNHFQTIKLT